MRIVVLAGGTSTERDVSISSGLLVAAALREKGHEVVLLDVFKGYEQDICDVDALFKQNYSFTDSIKVGDTISDIEEVREQRRDKSNRWLGENIIDICACADIIFLALHGGAGENGQIQATLDLLGAEAAMSWDCFPCVVKPCSGGSSVGITIAQNADEYKDSVKEAFGYGENEIVVEEYIKGREFSVGLLGGRALPPIEIIPAEGFYDYKTKYQAGAARDVCPADITEDEDRTMRSAAEAAYEALHLESYARIDFILTGDGKAYCLEANTLPGMTPTSLLPQEAKAEGTEYADLCEKIIEISLKKYE